MEETPPVVAPVTEAAVETPVAAAPVKGPAHAIRTAQALIAGGLFPGQMAPSIVEAFTALGAAADKIELEAAHEAEFKARQKA